MNPQSGLLGHFRENKTLTLLISLLVLIFFFPFFESSRVASVIFVILYTAVLLSGVYAISYDARYIAVGFLLVSPILVAQWSNIILGSREIDMVSQVGMTVFMIYTLVALLERVFKSKRVGVNEIYGSICAFVLMGMVFALFYLEIETAAPGSFHFTYPRAPLDSSPFLYFSFSALAGGGSDVSAVAPLARSLALVEVLIGVIYVAVLIGRLVSASFIDTPEEKRDAEADDRRENQKRLRELLRDPASLKVRPVGLVAACVLMNFLASVLMIHLKLPFFLDSWGTSLAVLLGGWWQGALTAVLYNLIIAATFWGWPSWIWMLSSLLVAGATWFFMKRDWVNLFKPLHLIGAGILIGSMNSVLAQVIMHFAAMEPYQGTLPVFRFFLRVTSNATFAALAEKMFVEVADKTISLIVASVAVFLLHDFLMDYKKKFDKKFRRGLNLRKDS